MKKNKKALIAVSFCLGAVMFVTTAFADIASKTGYDQLKEAVKFTAESCSKEFQSVTIDATVTLKDNGKMLTTSSSTEKVDNAKKMRMSSTSSEYGTGDKDSSLSYTDNKNSIWYNSDSDVYYVTEYTDAYGFSPFSNPFEKDRVNDIEKILDALVGNLKDYVVVDEKPDGSKELSGSLNEGQIPALVNAVSSFAFKQTFSGYARDEKVSMPQLLDDIFIKNVKGNAVINKDGIIESVLATGVLSGKDKSGNPHDLTIEILVRISDVNSTSVSMPDLKGKKVEKNIVKSQNQNVVTKKFIGKYKNDIVIEKDDKFIKIGERIVEIAHIDDKHISGRYYENFREGYDEYSKDKTEISFDAQITDNNNNAQFEYTNPSGKKDTGWINFDIMGGRFYFSFNRSMGQNGVLYDSNFSRVFDE